VILCDATVATGAAALMAIRVLLVRLYTTDLYCLLMLLAVRTMMYQRKISFLFPLLLLILVSFLLVVDACKCDASLDLHLLGKKPD